MGASTRRRIIEFSCLFLMGQPSSIWAAGPRSRIGILSPNTPENARTHGTPLNTLLSTLADFGLPDGKSVTFEFRFASHQVDRLASLASELVAAKPDVIYTWTGGAAEAISRATSSIPTIIAPVNEGLMERLVPDFSHPDRNITGFTNSSRQQHEKCLELLKEAAPHVRRVGVLFNPLNKSWDKYPGILNDAGQMLGLELLAAQAEGVKDVDRVFAAMLQNGVDSLLALDDSTLVASLEVPKPISDLIIAHRLPAVSDAAALASAGGLLSLALDRLAFSHKAALYIYRVVGGAKISELPVQRPTEFALIINLKVARELKLSLPTPLLAAADKIIE